ncbi:hypothetical protein BGZ52_011290 [Haplosporangium bisporale]|nr:hypothetical protein BGZ52_011290 [Haplosporangium bisporale]
MPIRWSFVVLILLFLISLLTYARIARSTSTSSQRIARSPSSPSLPSLSNNSPFKKSSLTLHHLQEERTLRDRNARLQQDLEEDILQLELECSSPNPAVASSPSSSSNSLSRDELALQQADFEQELALETQRLIQKHRYDGTLLNESPSAFQRYLKRQLRRQRRLQSAYKATLQQQSSLSYNSQECIAWRAKKKLLSRLSTTNSKTIEGTNNNRNYKGSSNQDTALSRFQQFHPDRQGLEADSVLAKTLDALSQKRYTDINGFVVELDPVKIAAGSRRASSYQNDDIHVLVLDMQWDPEVVVVVGNVLDETVKLRQEGYRPVMLNVGHEELPGGDYHLDTVKDNEADLFRRTTLHQCLDQEPRRSRFYPLPEFGGIYCPNQAVFRHGLDRDNEFMDRFEWISVVSVAPIPKLETREKDGGLGGVQFMDGEDDVLRRKILAAMKVGVSQGHDALVLPPHGTDAGQNPSEAIAAIYRSIIGRDFMGGRKRFQTYKKIVMVLDPEQAYKVVNETSNYRPPRPPVVATPLPVVEEEASEDGDNSNQDEVVDKNAPEADAEAEDEAEAEADADVDSQADAGVDAGVDAVAQVEAEGAAVDGDVLAKRFVNGNLDDEAPEYEDDNNLNDRSEEENGEITDEEDNASSAVTDEDSVEYKANNIVPGLYNDNDDDDEDEETINEDAAAEEEDEESELVPDDEVSESDALVEEQNVEEDEDSLNEVQALDEDVNDPLLSPDRRIDDDNADQDDQDEGYDGSHVDMSKQAQDENIRDENGDEDESQEEDEEEEEFVQVVETVQDVFERMLEPRSLLIIKNRARGLLDTDEADSKNRTLADVASPNPSASAGVVVPSATSATSATSALKR